MAGTSGNDFLTGTDAADTISGFDGIDDIKGGKGADRLFGDGGNDAIDGGDGNDRIDGGADDDNLGGGGGDDSIAGGLGNDVIGGGLGDDTLYGGDGDDFFFRESGSNRIFGGAGSDTYSGGGIDVVSGGNGDDVFLLEGHDNAGRATMTGGAGRDLYVMRDVGAGTALPANVITDFDAGAGGDLLDLDEFIELSGATGGYEGGNPFNAAIGILRIEQSGADALVQWNGSAHLGLTEWKTIYRLKNTSASALTPDNIVGDIPPGGSPVPGDIYTGTASADSLQGGFFNDTLAGLDGGDLLEGRGGDDSISGGEGDDTLAGGSGNDRLLGGTGNDLFVVDSSGKSSLATGGAGVDIYRLEIGFLKEHRGYAVTDFTAGPGGDLIDVNPLLVHSAMPYGTLPVTFGYTGGNPFATDFLRWVDTGADLKLQWDSDGADDARAGWQTVLTLKNRDVEDLTVDNMVSWIPPDGSTIPGKTLTGSGSDDRLMGSIFGDDISGLDGADHLNGNAGSDVVHGGAGEDTIDGGLGNDTLYGDEGNDRLDGGIGNDWIHGGAGDDEFSDRFGNNRLFGDDGNDSFRLGSDGGLFWSGAETVTGGAGSDLYWVYADMNRLVDLKDRVTDFTVGPGGDLLDLRNLPIGVFKTAFELGHLRLFQSGAHTLLQFDLDGAAGNDFGRVTLVTLNNVTASSITSDNFLGEIIVGTSGNDDLVGGLGNDTVQGLGGNDTLDGSLGKDILEGGTGDDLYYVDNRADQIVEEPNDAPGALLLQGGSGAGRAGAAGTVDAVIAAVNYSLANVAFVENLTLSGKASRATGNTLDNKLTGNAGSDTLDGGAGNDTLDGKSGSDRLIGGDGNDTLIWGSGDRIDGGAGTDTLKAGNLDLTALANDRIVNVETINLTGGGNNTLTLARSDVLAINDADTLKVIGNSGDVVNAAGFVRDGSLDGFKRYTGGAATLLVEAEINVIT